MSRPLRILRVIPFFEPATGFGGSVTQAAAVSEALAARGHRVRVVTSDLGVDAAVPRNAWVGHRGFQVFYGRAAGRHRLPPYLATPATRRELAGQLADTDVMTVNVGLTLLGGTARRLAVGAGVPYVFNAEGALCPVRLRIKRLQKLLFVRAVEGRVLRDAAALQALTGKDAADYARLGADPARIQVVPNGVAMPGLPGAADGAAFRAGLGIPADAPVVAFIGRLHAIKGLDLLVAAMAERMRRDQRVHLVVAGPDEGPLGDLQRLVQERGVAARVSFTGHLDAAQRTAALAAADVFALTSRTEGLPLAVLEAAAAGVPLLITDRCNVPEVADYDAGLVVSPDVAAVRDGLDILLDDRAALRRRSANARCMAEELFDLERTVDRLEALYRSVAK